MKYIRTKDGIWLFAGTHHNGDGIIGKKHEIDFGYCFAEKEIIKQADTIEQLCDMFILLNEDNGRHRICLPYEIDLRTSVYEGLGTIHQKIYGAIWTEWGLKYVAKMNEKGDFELL